MASQSTNDKILEQELKELKENTPEHLQDNSLILYFRCKVSHRNLLMSKCDPVDRAKIEWELERIGRLRSEFPNNNSENKLLIQNLSNSQREWRECAKARCHEERIKLGIAGSSESRERHACSLETIENRPPPVTSSQNDIGYGFRASEITLKRTGTNFSYGDYRIKSHAVNDILIKKDNNPLRQRCEDNAIRYFHFPANHMLWVEEAIARYYGEDRGEYDYRKAENYRPKSSDILCREFWKAQQHGGLRDPIHARHMRSQCSFIPTHTSSTDDPSTVDPTSIDPSKNFVIFMPYLHWELDKRRKKMADVMKTVTHSHRKKMRDEFPHFNGEPREKFVEAVQKARLKYGFRIPTEPVEKETSRESWPSTLLGKYLLNVARVYDAMDIEQEARMLRENLYPKPDGVPPLHVRRTLDQSYYWKLESTEERDEDQVVYRGTKAGKSIFRTPTRAIMVDQLWLYILDERTIISFFPRRWGRNKPDSSGVHKGIRARLEHIRSGEIQSAYDLALLIMNQCSTVFFDRTKPIDVRPQVLDIFANAIAHISELKTIAFEGFWRHIRMLRLIDPHLSNIETIEAAARIYLDVNPEGTMLRETHDITDELSMMARIYLQQQRVAAHFSKALQEINEQKAPSTPRQLLKDINRTVDDIDARQAGTYVEGDGYGILPATNQETSRPKPIPDNTIQRARGLLEDIRIRLGELQDLEGNTKDITEHLKDLLDLKQQQASIIEAKAALARADETVIQGRAIIMFTIMTIIFQPLSFISSVFGMNAKELSGAEGATMSLRYQFKLMFPVSLAVTVVSLALAFSSWIRNLLTLVAGVVWAAAVEYSGAHRLWQFCIRKNDAKSLYQSRHEMTRRIYGRRDHLKYQKAWDKATAKEEGDIEMGPVKKQGQDWPPVKRWNGGV